jgi:hypothetical protein
MRYKQIVIRRGDDLVPIRLGKALDARLAGRETVIVVRIEKTEVYEVTGIHRMTGSARRFSFASDQVQAEEPDTQS